MSARERLAVDEVHLPFAAGHNARYQLAAEFANVGMTVADVACGVGYGASFFAGVHYHGYDRPGVADHRFVVGGGSTLFHDCDLDDPSWRPVCDADMTVCFETLEHVADPVHLAAVLAEYTTGLIVVSVPTVPTVGSNPHHRHDFTVEDVPPMFPGFGTFLAWEQASELSHVWMLAR